MRKPLIAGNWKLNKLTSEAIELVGGLKRELREIKDVEVVVCPAYTVLSEVSKKTSDSHIKVGAQDVFWEDRGAYTGEVSSSMLKDVGCEYVIVGHSERRQYFGESNEDVSKKLKSLLQNGLYPILCVGERLEQREAGNTFEIVKDQLLGALNQITNEQLFNITVAYEPVWAIGTGKNATPKQAQEVHSYIRGLIQNEFSKDCADKIRILYGGSVNPENIRELIKQPDIDGALVGGASLKVDSFSTIVKITCEVKKGCIYS